MTERQSRHRAVMDLNRDEWLNALGMDAKDIPKAVIMEDSWWRAQRTAWRLSYLDEVRELAFPDMFFGLWQGSPVVYSCVPPPTWAKNEGEVQNELLLDSFWEVPRVCDGMRHRDLTHPHPIIGRASR